MSLSKDTNEPFFYRVLVATDFGPASEMATAYGAILAKYFGSRLAVVHVIDPSIATASEATAAGRAREEVWRSSLEKMGHVIDQLNRLGINVDSRELDSPHPATAIVELANASNASILVLGTSAPRGPDKLILGSCAEDVIHHARCPVITLGPKAKPSRGLEWSLKTIVFATDMQHQVVEKAGLTLAFAKAARAKVYICYVADGSGTGAPGASEIQSQAGLTLQKGVPASSYSCCNIEYVVRDGSPSEQILSLASEVKADLIVMGARHRSSRDMAHLTQGIVEHVLAEAACPVMTLRTD